VGAVTKRKKSYAQNSRSRSQSAVNAYPWVLLAICILMFYLLITESWAFKLDSQFYFAAGSIVIFIATFVFKENRQILFSRVSKISVLLLAQCVLYFISIFYATYPKLALQQFYLNIGALLLFMAAYVAFIRNGTNIKVFAKLFSIAIVIASIISIELATSGFLKPILQAMANLLNATIPDGYAAFETNTRIITVIGNANVFAPFAVFGMLVAIWNFGRPGERTNRSYIDLSIAIACGTAFVLCFSLGTILSYIVMLIAVFFITKKEDRSERLLVYLFTLVISLVAASAAFALRDKSLLPTLAVIAISTGAAFIYTRMKPLKLPSLTGALKKALIAGILAVCAVFAVLAFLLKGPYTLAQTASFRRAVALSPGAYSFSTTFDNASPDDTITIEINSMSYAEAALKEKTVITTTKLKSGETADFIVPNSSAAVFISVTADNNLRVNNASIKGNGSEKQLSLKYTLLPEFIVNRLQGFWVNDNAIQRFIFFRDGIRIGMKAPIFGLGGGAFGGGLYSVADYYYQTKHAHNEYIQRFVEGGLVGAVLFIGFAVYVLKAILKARRNKSDQINPIVTMLGACMVMVFVHALIEVDFMFGSYRVASALLFALTAVICDDNLKLGQRLKTSAIAATSVLFVSIALLCIGQYAAIKSLQKNPTLQTLQTAMKLDPVNKDDYKLSYLLNTMGVDNPVILETQEKYITSMEGDINGYDSRAQFLLKKLPPDYDRGIAAAEAYIHENRVNPEAWDAMLSLYLTVLDSGDATASEKISGSIHSLYSYLNELNQTLPKHIETKLADFAYLRAESIDKGMLNTIIDSRIQVDLNHDGISDILEKTDGNDLLWKLNAALPGVYLIKVYQPASAACEIKVNDSAYGTEYAAAEGCFVAYVFGLSQPVSELSIKTSNSENAYFTIESVR
jgi:hypothetical protein